MIINHNLNAMNAYRQLGIGNNNGAKSMEKLSSGYRINRAGDDAAGLSISEKMRGQIRGLNMASKNSQDGISLIQTAEGALTETHAILQRMRELAVQAGNDTNVADDRTEIQNEINQLTEELDRIGNQTEFNTQKLLDGAAGEGFTATFQVGANNGQTFAISIGDMRAKALGLTGEGSNGGEGTAATITGTVDLSTTVPNISTKSLTIAIDGGSAVTVDITLFDGSKNIDDLVGAINGTTGLNGVASKSEDGKYIIITSGTKGAESSVVIGGTAAADLGLSTNEVKGEAGSQTGGEIDVSTSAKANAAIEKIDNAIKQVSAQRSKLGAWQNRLEHTIKNLDTSAENLQAAESRIRDVDMAKEMMEFAKNNILQQAAQAMLAQANQQPQGVLQLLR